MERSAAQSTIETQFRQQAQRDDKVLNAYLLVHADQLGIDLRVAEGATGNTAANTAQPIHLASVGKLFTATIIARLHDAGKLSFDDRIARYLDADLMNGLHVHRGTDYSGEIQIRQLLNQSSGLEDCFWPLLQKVTADPTMTITPRDAVLWGKENLKPKREPGVKHHYTDTNYYLLGLIVESITGRPFHEVLHEEIFDVLGMRSAFMHGYSEPAVASEYPLASLTIDGVDYANAPGFARIDYAGGGVVATLDDYLTFMRALVRHELVRPESLERMLSDEHSSFPGIRYGYATWRFITIPLLAPAKHNCWGCAGVTGAFMFFHPQTDAYIIGSFGDASYRSKALRYMHAKVIRPLLQTR